MSAWDVQLLMYCLGWPTQPDRECPEQATLATEKAAACARQEILQVAVLFLSSAALIDVVCKQTLSAATTSALALFLASLFLGTSAAGLPCISAALSPLASECILHIALAWVFVVVELPELVPGCVMSRPEWIKWTAISKVILLFYLPASSYKRVFVGMRFLELLLCSVLQYYVAQSSTHEASDSPPQMAEVHEDVFYFEDAEYVMRVFGRLSLVSFNAWLCHWRVRVWTKKVLLEEQLCQDERQDTAGYGCAGWAGLAGTEGEEMEGEEVEGEEPWEDSEVDDSDENSDESDEDTYTNFVRDVERLWNTFQARSHRKVERAGQKRDLSALVTFARWNLRHEAAQSSKSLPALPPRALMLSARFLCGRTSLKQRRAIMKTGDSVDRDGYESDVSVDSGGSVSRVFAKVKRLVHAWW